MDENGVLSQAFDPVAGALRITGAYVPLTLEFLQAKVGGYYNAPGHITNQLLTNNRQLFFPVRFPRQRTLDRLTLYVGTAGDAASVARLGIYADDGVNGQPGALIVDAGTVATATTGGKAATINQVLVPGIYWFSCVAQSPGTLPAVFAYSYQLAGVWQSGINAFATGLYKNSVAGALPDPATVDGDIGNFTPAVGWRVAA